MLDRIASVLKRDVGLEAAHLGPGALERVVRERKSVLGLADLASYWTVLSESPEERQALIEAIIVPETWFFRDRGAFDALVEVTVPEWRRDRAGPMRLLSLPCSTGEEPYSIAMALLDAGVAASDFRIDAMDISERSLATARAALYRPNSFRGQALDFRSRYFDAQGELYRLRPVVTGCVRFSRANLLDFEASCVAPYDAVFCRNLLIYFDRATQDRALVILKRLLRPTGVLFLGPSEAGLALLHGWPSVPFPSAFAFRCPLSSSASPAAVVAAKRHRAPVPKSASLAPVRPADRAPNTASTPAALSARPARQGPDALLAQAQRLADAGRLDEAAERCTAVLQQHGPQANAYFLLGLVRDARGDANSAMALYRKALYMEPAHPEALLHCAALLERQGDHAGAARLRERMQRRGTSQELPK